MEPSRHPLPGHQHRLSSTDARQTRGSFVCLRTLKAKASIVCQHRQPWFILVPGRRVLFSQIPLFRSRRTHCSSFHFTGQADPVKYVTSYNGRIRKHPRELSDYRKQLLPLNRSRIPKYRHPPWHHTFDVHSRVDKQAQAHKQALWESLSAGDTAVNAVPAPCLKDSLPQALMLYFCLKMAGGTKTYPKRVERTVYVLLPPT